MLSRQYFILHIGLSLNTPPHTPPTHPTHTHQQKKERKKDQIIECLIILMPNLINHKITYFLIQVLVHINNNQLKYFFFC